MNKNDEHSHEENAPEGFSGDSSRIWIHEVTPALAAQVSNAIWDIAQKNPGPILLYIDSPGGDVDAMATIIAAMESIPNPIITVAMGKAMSAGAIILAHGDMRLVSPHARVMVHEVSSGAIGNVNDMVADAQENVRVNDYWMRRMAKVTGRTVKQFKKLFTNERRELYFGPQEAVEFGLADAVGVPNVVTNATFTVSVFQKPEKVKKAAKKK